MSYFSTFQAPEPSDSRRISFFSLPVSTRRDHSYFISFQLRVCFSILPITRASCEKPLRYQPTGLKLSHVNVSQRVLEIQRLALLLGRHFLFSKFKSAFLWVTS